MKYKKILVWPKINDPEVDSYAEIICSWLLSNGHNARISNNFALLGQDDNWPDLVICLGGDGTILGLSRRLAGKNIPVFGINFGHVGFLCNAHLSDWKISLEQVLNGETKIFRSLALSWHLQRSDNIIASGMAANDLVLSRGTLARLILVDISIDDYCLGIMRGDGIICCTPLGSSGYNISAGGSILQLDLDVFGLTPVCPFINKIAPLIVKGEASVDFHILKNSADCYITIDGQEGQKLEYNDVIHIKGYPSALTFIGKNTFFERLQRRGLPLEQDLKGWKK